ncbi:MAG: glycogen debranching enzyme family protein [Deltaproteobacteria bacterium]|nr:glycogen debranching enzyme family protein [Deltaproteobacteria bacterium]MCW5808380.1 glycogen debranching enzyme family protein [Deltaproteobacteria bacterium]
MTTEWLETDGLGGYAMGAADLIRSRRYHALLLAATRPPEGRMVLVADMEVFVETATNRYALMSHRYRGGFVHPDGAARITSFAHAPWPRWQWTLPDGAVVELELAVAPGAPRTALRWRRVAGSAVALHVQPLLAGRDYHATHHENGGFGFEPELDGSERVTWRPYPGVPAVTAVANAVYQHAPDWYRAFDLADEAERGLDHLEDLAAPGTLTFDLAAGPAALLLAADAPPAGRAAELVEAVFAAERTRRGAFPSELARAADAYIARRDGGKTVLAGYPWFSDWGRDTFISLRGLTLATGRRDEARAILVQWAGAISDGMLPNRYDEGATTPEYNSVDAALWFVIAADAYLAGAATAEDRRLLQTAIGAIVEGYARGTRHGIRADGDGLLACGEPGWQLTWMDAKIGGDVITPRIGKPVEIQALWINALAIAGRAAEAERARAAFGARFWHEDGRYLYDVVDCDHVAGTADASCRPNQLFAIGGLPRQVLDGARAAAVVDTVERVLWTPAGPRTLAPGDPRYCARFTGGPEVRDRAYHQGTVWPWLAGAFVEAWVRVRGNTVEAKREAKVRFLEPLLARRDVAGLGHVAEICEAEPPHRPVGCPFQAWSLAELIRLDALLA